MVDRPGIVRLVPCCGVLSSCVLRNRVVVRIAPVCRIVSGLSRCPVARLRRSTLVDRCRIWIRVDVRGCVGLDVAVDVGAVAFVFVVVGCRLRVALLRSVSCRCCRSGAVRRFVAVVACGVGALWLVRLVVVCVGEVFSASLCGGSRLCRNGRRWRPSLMRRAPAWLSPPHNPGTL